MFGNTIILKKPDEPEYAVIRKSYHILAAILGGFLLSIGLGIGIFLWLGTIGVLWSDVTIFGSFIVSILLIFILAAYLLVRAFFMVLLINYFYGVAIVVPEHFWYVRHTPLFKEMLNTVDWGFIAVVEPVETGIIGNILRYGDVMVRLMDGNVVEVDKVPAPPRIVELMNSMKDFMVNPPREKPDEDASGPDQDAEHEKDENKQADQEDQEQPGKKDQRKTEEQPQKQGEEEYTLFHPQMSVHSKRTPEKKAELSKDTDANGNVPSDIKSEESDEKKRQSAEVQSENFNPLPKKESPADDDAPRGNETIAPSTSENDKNVLSNEEKEQLKQHIENEVKHDLKEEVKEEIKEEVKKEVKKEVLEEVKKEVLENAKNGVSKNPGVENESILPVPPPV